MNKNHGWCRSRNCRQNTNLDLIALAKRLSMVRTPETKINWSGVTTHIVQQESHHRQSLRTLMGRHRRTQSRRRSLGNGRVRPPGELREIPNEWTRSSENQPESGPRLPRSRNSSRIERIICGGAPLWIRNGPDRAQCILPRAEPSQRTPRRIRQTL